MAKSAGVKQRRTAKKKGYYDRQFYRTTANKNRKQLKRIQEKNHWKSEGVTKKGHRVKGSTPEQFERGLAVFKATKPREQQNE